VYVGVDQTWQSKSTVEGDNFCISCEGRLGSYTRDAPPVDA